MTETKSENRNGIRGIHKPKGQKQVSKQHFYQSQTLKRIILSLKRSFIGTQDDFSGNARPALLQSGRVRFVSPETAVAVLLPHKLLYFNKLQNTQKSAYKDPQDFYFQTRAVLKDNTA